MTSKTQTVGEGSKKCRSLRSTFKQFKTIISLKQVVVDQHI